MEDLDEARAPNTARAAPHVFALAKSYWSLLYRPRRKGNIRLQRCEAVAVNCHSLLRQPAQDRSPPVQLIADNLTVERGERTILRDVSFTAEAGEALVLVGPNGAGKTTLLRTIAGFLRPISGTVRLAGGDSDLTAGEQAHFVGHANAIKANLSVAENIAFWARYLGGSAGIQARVEHALDAFAISALSEFPAAYLSAGQRRRCGLARLLVAKRALWLLDEPTVSLDAASTKLLSAAVNAHLEGGGLVIAATHLPLGFAKAREFDLSAARAPVAA